MSPNAENQVTSSFSNVKQRDSSNAGREEFALVPIALRSLMLANAHIPVKFSATNARTLDLKNALDTLCAHVTTALSGLIGHLVMVLAPRARDVVRLQDGTNVPSRDYALPMISHRKENRHVQPVEISMHKTR
jgi:hypothetical protein